MKSILILPVIALFYVSCAEKKPVVTPPTIQSVEAPEVEQPVEEEVQVYVSKKPPILEIDVPATTVGGESHSISQQSILE